jgi:hypothetical protein
MLRCPGATEVGGGPPISLGSMMNLKNAAASPAPTSGPTM